MSSYEKILCPVIDFRFSTIVDVLHVPYVAEAKSAGIDIDQFPALQSWYENMLQRPAVLRGLRILEKEASQ